MFVLPSFGFNLSYEVFVLVTLQVLFIIKGRNFVLWDVILDLILPLVSIFLIMSITVPELCYILALELDPERTPIMQHSTLPESIVSVNDEKEQTSPKSAKDKKGKKVTFFEQEDPVSD